MCHFLSSCASFTWEASLSVDTSIAWRAFPFSLACLIGERGKEI